mmetsp:Transcript_9897/g.24507  ORF Transcript_9897/g.24507 Transcript_9897/m.24507 type:complete len:456 (+) Transcript_9897:164-1531(+)
MPSMPENVDERHSEENEDMVEDKSNPKSHKRNRQNFTWRQVSVLEQVFETDPLPWPALRVELANRLGITPRCVQVWFQNRRQKWKATQQAQGSEKITLPRRPIGQKPDERKTLNLDSILQPRTSEASIGLVPAARLMPFGSSLPMAPKLVPGQHMHGQDVDHFYSPHQMPMMNFPTSNPSMVLEHYQAQLRAQQAKFLAINQLHTQELEARRRENEQLQNLVIHQLQQQAGVGSMMHPSYGGYSMPTVPMESSLPSHHMMNSTGVRMGSSYPLLPGAQGEKNLSALGNGALMASSMPSLSSSASSLLFKDRHFPQSGRLAESAINPTPHVSPNTVMDGSSFLPRSVPSKPKVAARDKDSAKRVQHTKSTTSEAAKSVSMKGSEHMSTDEAAIALAALPCAVSTVSSSSPSTSHTSSPNSGPVSSCPAPVLASVPAFPRGVKRAFTEVSRRPDMTV